jgi:hypothetical protein
MMNPFLQVPPPKADKSRLALSEEQAAHQYSRTVSIPAPRSNLGLFIGKLLIRMGKKLAEQDIEMKTSKEHA